MSDPSQELDFTFDLGDPGEPVESLGELLSAAAEDEDELSEARQASRMFGLNMPEEHDLPDDLGGDNLRRNADAVTIESRPTGSGQAVVTKVEEREPTEEEIAEAFNKLSPGQQANYRARPWLWAPGAIGHPGVKKTKPAPTKGRKANRVNVRDIVENICGESGLDPFSVMALLMLNNDEARLKLGLTEKERVSTMLRAKCAMELASYMSPKLKSIEVKDNKEKPAQVQVFLPANNREAPGSAVLRLPVRDGVQVEMSPETAAQMIRDGLVDVPDDAVEE